MEGWAAREGVVTVTVVVVVVVVVKGHRAKGSGSLGQRLRL